MVKRVKTRGNYSEMIRGGREREERVLVAVVEQRDTVYRQASFLILFVRVRSMPGLSTYPSVVLKIWEARGW